MDQVCLDCAMPMHGRHDKKFCSDHCRNTYNNRQNSDANNYMRNVNNIIRRNRRILHTFAPGGKVNTVHRKKLEEKGFHFGYHTHTFTTRKGDNYKFCYDMGYLPVHENFIMIVHEKSQPQQGKSAPEFLST
ncbi:MAG: hypothetical protein ACRCYO_07755 [Bacteroidia bacterium]